jgi:surface protein
MLKINGKTITGVVYKGKRIQRIMVGGKKYYDMYDGKIIGNALEAGSVSIGGKTYSYGAGYFELNIGELSVGSLYGAFSNKKLSTITHIGIDTRRVTYMNGMFQGCSSLTSINLGDKFDTSNVTNMSGMFYQCKALSTLDLGDKFDTSNVTDMSGMFYQCSALSTLDLGDKFDAGKVIKVNDMFQNCPSLKTITGCIKNLSISLNLSPCPLDHDSALRIINGLATVTTAQTLTLRSTTKSTLSATEKAILINKGWTLA